MPSDSEKIVAAGNETVDSVTYAASKLAAAAEPALSAVSDKLLQYLQTTEDFAVAQAPELVQEILVWSLFYRGLSFFVCAFAIFICYKLTRFVIKKIFEVEPENAILLSALHGTISLAIGIPITIAAYNHLLIMGKIYFAPRLYLIEYLRDLIN